MKPKEVLSVHNNLMVKHFKTEAHGRFDYIFRYED